MTSGSGGPAIGNEESGSGKTKRRIHTVGHSTRSAGEFTGLLLAHGIEHLADVRRFPQSRRHPQFNADALETALADKGIRYTHIPQLGGRRQPRPDSPNSAWRNTSFRGYADHMLTDEFELGLLRLFGFTETGRTALMCAEAVWWQCHRALLADALVCRGWAVAHILTEKAVKMHTLNEFAREKDGVLIYPGLL